jgi:hypothetical protein
MLDENIWLQLNEDEKFEELQSCLKQLNNIHNGSHELSKTREQGKLADIRKQLEEKIYKIIELENAT